MAYAAPQGNEVDFLFTGTPTYVAPLGDEVNFNHILNVDVPVNMIAFTGTSRALHIYPYLASAHLSALALSNTTNQSDLVAGLTSLHVDDLAAIFNTESLRINRGSLANLIVGSLQTLPFSVVPGPISLSVDALNTTSSDKPTLSSLYTELECPSVSMLLLGVHTVPGDISLGLKTLYANASATVFDSIYQPIKGLGTVDIQAYYSNVVNNTNNNGGGISNIRIKNMHNSIFPSITKEVAFTGTTIYRKIFWKNVSIGKSNLLDGIVYVNKEYEDSYRITIFPCSYTETQQYIGNDRREFGTAVLLENNAIGSTVITASLKSSTLDTFKIGDAVVISNIKYNERFKIIDLQKNSNVLTLTVDTPTKYVYNINDVVSSCIELSTLSTYTPKGIVTSASGIFDNTFAIENHGTGSIKDAWTITFNSSTTFTCSNTQADSFSGDIFTDLIPINPITGTPYFVLDKRSWKGTFTNSDTVKFVTNIAFVAIWAKLYIPANSSHVNSIGNFNCTIQGYS